MIPGITRRPMPKSAMSNRAWRLDTLEATSTTTEMSGGSEPATYSIDGGPGPVEVGSLVTRILKRWTPSMRMGMGACFRRFRRGGVPFEEALHAFAKVLETADSPAA